MGMCQWHDYSTLKKTFLGYTGSWERYCIFTQTRQNICPHTWSASKAKLPLPRLGHNTKLLSKTEGRLNIQRISEIFCKQCEAGNQHL